jgi:hypothetical protein
LTFYAHYTLTLKLHRFGLQTSALTQPKTTLFWTLKLYIYKKKKKKKGRRKVTLGQNGVAEPPSKGKKKKKIFGLEVADHPQTPWPRGWFAYPKRPKKKKKMAF